MVVMMKQVYKVCIVFVLLVTSYCLGCVDNSEASETDNRLTLESKLVRKDTGPIFIIHDNYNNVTLYVNENLYGTAIAAVPDSMLDKNN